MPSDRPGSSVREQPPEGLPPLARALWHDDRNEWDAAHDIVASDEGRLAAWVYAYLHRREGDPGNARYWYARAGQSLRVGSFEQERQELIVAIDADAGNVVGRSHD